tara:strand:+ start:1694 stop:1936 length:243 start_codon:yes stop_codon:yes gene_type:complete
MARPLPHWPRVLHAVPAAAYAGYRGERTFRAAVAAGEMPPAFKIGGKEAWDVHELDAAIDAIKASSGGKNSWRERMPERV